MLLEDVEVISNKVVAEGFYRMALKSFRVVKEAKPGQFVHLKTAPGRDPLLRRPLSVHSVDDSETFSVLYEVKGEGTENLARLKPRDEISVLGPSGNGFSYDARLKRLILAGGGIGAAPLLFAAQEGLRRKIEVTMLVGARTKDRLLCVADFKSLGCSVKTISDDGSSGQEGYVTDLIEETIVGSGTGPAAVFACGPKPMMRRAYMASALYDVPCQVSLEEVFACGAGVCYGCAVMTGEGYKRVCLEGPVFDAGEIEWEQ